jgi:hypothetical protein
MEFVGPTLDGRKVITGDLDGGRVGIGIQFRTNFSAPLVVVVAATGLTITSKLTSGLRRQFCVMKLKRRCSIVIHLLVPGGN